MDLSWLCFVTIMLIMIPAIYYGVTSRLKYGRQFLKGFSLFSNPKSIKSKTRFTKLDEFYEAISALIEWLKKDGHLEESHKLGTAMVAGATGSEILGDIMLALKSMKGKYSPELKSEINECFEFALNHRKVLGLDSR